MQLGFVGTGAMGAPSLAARGRGPQASKPVFHGTPGREEKVVRSRDGKRDCQSSRHKNEKAREIWVTWRI